MVLVGVVARALENECQRCAFHPDWSPTESAMFDSLFWGPTWAVLQFTIFCGRELIFPWLGCRSLCGAQDKPDAAIYPSSYDMGGDAELDVSYLSAAGRTRCQGGLTFYDLFGAPGSGWVPARVLISLVRKNIAPPQKMNTRRGTIKVQIARNGLSGVWQHLATVKYAAYLV